MMRRGWTVAAGAFVVFVMAAGLAKMPVPYVALGPGRTLNTLGTINGDEVISVKGAPTSTSKGHLNLTTVSVYDGLDVFSSLRMWFNDEIAVVPRELVYPPGQSEKQIDEESEAEFSASQQSAEVAALRELGYPVHVIVSKLRDGSPAAGKLQPGDELLKVDDNQVTSASRLQELVTAKKPGSMAAITYKRGEATSIAEITVDREGKNSDKGALKVAVEQRQPHDFQVDFDLDGIGGPSAGLMFALGIVDKLDPVDLTGGRYVAGTGGIDDDGNISGIGGIPQKMISAREVGARVFLVPADNCGQAKRTQPKGLQLVRVSTLDNALTALAQLREGRNVPAC